MGNDVMMSKSINTSSTTRTLFHSLLSIIANCILIIYINVVYSQSLKLLSNGFISRFDVENVNILWLQTCSARLNLRVLISEGRTTDDDRYK